MNHHPAPDDYRADIPRETAIAAHTGTSFSPERRADTVREAYQQKLETMLARLAAHGFDGGTTDRVAEEFDRYRAGLRKRTLAYLHSRNGLVSTMIAGGSNFPAARMNKRADIFHRRLEELIDWEERAGRAAAKALRPDLRPIMAGDADAIERLAAEIVTLQARQEQWTDTNRLVRAGTLPKSHTVPGFRLRNNGANIRAKRARLEQLEHAAAQPVTETTVGAVTIEANPGENRIRLTFPGKPEPETRARLKSAGFRWAPSQGAWSGYYNTARLAAAKEIAATT